MVRLDMAKKVHSNSAAKSSCVTYIFHCIALYRVADLFSILYQISPTNPPQS